MRHLAGVQAVGERRTDRTAVVAAVDPPTEPGAIEPIHDRRYPLHRRRLVRTGAVRLGNAGWDGLRSLRDGIDPGVVRERVASPPFRTLLPRCPGLGVALCSEVVERAGYELEMRPPGIDRVELEGAVGDHVGTRQGRQVRDLGRLELLVAAIAPRLRAIVELIEAVHEAAIDGRPLSLASMCRLGYDICGRR